MATTSSACDQLTLSQLTSWLCPNGESINLTRAQELAAISQITCASTKYAQLTTAGWNDDTVVPVRLRFLNKTGFKVTTDTLGGRVPSEAMQGPQHIQYTAEAAFDDNMLQTINGEIDKCLKAPEAVKEIGARYCEGELEFYVATIILPNSIKATLYPPDQNTHQSGMDTAAEYVSPIIDLPGEHGSRIPFDDHVALTTTGATINGKSVVVEYGWMKEGMWNVVIPIVEGMEAE